MMPSLFGGEGMGAQRAARQVAFRAEAAARDGLHYAQSLLDLVKAFERVHHWLLLREAIRLGYPVWKLRLSVATYRMPRMLRVGQAVSKDQVEEPQLDPIGFRGPDPSKRFKDIKIQQNHKINKTL